MVLVFPSMTSVLNGELMELALLVIKDTELKTEPALDYPIKKFLISDVPPGIGTTKFV